MKPRLLVVDDDPDTRELLDHALSRAGFEVRLARAGLEAVDCARQFRPELIVLDLMLPDVDGYTVVELLRRDPETRAIPVFLVSAAFGALGAHPPPGPGGITRYCTKSIALAELVSRIRETLSLTTLPTSAASGGKAA